MKFKGQIDFKQFIRPSNNYCHYGFAQMFWLELVMNLLGYNSYRSKIARLKELKEFNQLESFYKSIGIDYHSPYLNELYVWLTHFKQYIQNLVHIAVDGAYAGNIVIADAIKDDAKKELSPTPNSLFTTIWFNYVKFVVPVIILVIFISNLI